MADLTKEELIAKKSVERGNKIAAIYRETQELERLNAELDSAKANYDTPENSAKYKAEINRKIKVQKNKIKLKSNAILGSSDNELVSEYKKTLSEDKSFSNVVNDIPNKVSPEETKALQEKTERMRDADKGTYNYGLKDINGNPILLKGKYADAQEKQRLKLELKKLKLSPGDNKEKIKEFEKNLAEKVLIPEIKEGLRSDRDNAEKEYLDRLNGAETEEDLDEVQKLKDVYTGKIESHDKFNTEDWNRNYSDKNVNIGINELGGIDKLFDYIKEEPAEEIPAPPKDANVETKPKSGTETENATTTTAPEQVSTGVEDRKTTTDEKGNVTVVPDAERDWETEFADAKKELEDYRSVGQDEFVHDYDPDYGSDTNGIDNLIDAGRGVIGMIGATEEIPEYQRGAMFSEAMGDAQRMKNEGLSSEELNVRKNFAERGYAYDIKNINRAAGGSAGVALGNMGRATSQLQDQYAKIAATDEAVRRGNQGAFRNMALKDEGINRQIFQDDFKVAMANKEAGAGLVQDVLKNIQERGDYNKMYGKGSIYANRMETQDKKEQMAIFDLEQGNKRRASAGEKPIIEKMNKAQQMIDEAAKIKLKGSSSDGKRFFKSGQI